MRRLVVLVFSVSFSLGMGLFSSAAVFAAELSPEQQGTISQNCASIKTSLQNLQKTDSRTRVYLGSIYNTVLNNFITPLNLRLVRSNLPNSDLTASQSDFTEARNDFAHQFVSYSQSLETLLTLDCQKDPESFYAQLETTRTERAALQKSVAKVQKVISHHLETVTNLKKGNTDEKTQ